MEEQETLTLTITTVVKPEPNLTAQDKEANSKQQILDLIANIARNYDWGVAVNGTLESTCSETVVIEDTKPDYVEE